MAESYPQQPPAWEPNKQQHELEPHKRASHNAQSTVQAIGAHPKWTDGKDLTPLRVNLIIATTCLFAFGNAYDVSNVANIQPAIYEAFGHIEILSWVAIGYSTASATTCLSSRLLGRLFNIKIITLVAVLLYIIGSIISATGNSIEQIIVGRVISGIGGGPLTQLSISYITLTAGPKTSQAMSFLGVSYTLGLIGGPLIGGAFANAEHATWRWAFWFVVPLMALGIPPVIFFFPGHMDRDPSRVSLLADLKRVDLLGFALNTVSIPLFIVALTLSGTVYPWNSGASIAIWVVWGLVTIAYGLQQGLYIFTSPGNRLVAWDLWRFRTVFLCGVCTFSSWVSYSALLYFLPLLYAFAHGLSPIDSAVRLLPFVGAYVVVVLVTGGALPAVKRYKLFYMIASPLVLIGGCLLATRANATESAGAVMGYSAVVGAGLGAMQMHGLAVSSAALPPDRYFDISTLQAFLSAFPAALGTALAGCVYQNVGFASLGGVLAPFDYSELDIREALGGLKSTILTQGGPEVQALAVEAIIYTLQRVFYIIVAAGGISCLAAAAMKWEDLGSKVKEEKE